MTNDTPCWFSVSAAETSRLRCAVCHQNIEIGPVADHHPSGCPTCGTECLFLPWNGRLIQIILQRSPAVVVSLIRWAQQHLDELEFIELIVSLEELATAFQPAEAVT